MNKIIERAKTRKDCPSCCSGKVGSQKNERNVETKEQFIEQVKRTIETHELVKAGETVLVALSGGADSTALLLALLGIGVRCEAAHCNFRLRGSESDGDEMFVRRLCQSRSVKIHVKSFDTEGYAKERSIGLETAARELRYAYFEEVLRDYRLDKTATGHHVEDNAETLLINLARGAGLRGLGGMGYKNGRVIRPLLDVTRADIEAFLAQNGQDYVRDSSNAVADTVRNKIRLQIMPLLREINPSASDTLYETAARLRDAYLIYKIGVEEMQRQVCDGGRISLARLRKMPAARTLLFEILSPYGFSPAQIAEIYEQMGGQPGKVFESAGWRLLRDRDCLTAERKGGARECLCTVLPLDGYVKVTPQCTFRISRTTAGKGFVPPHDKAVACFDLDKIEYPITVRYAKEGDRFVPFGMEGTKLVSDYLTDVKKNVFEKERQLVVCCGRQIAWLVGERPDNRFRIDEGTKRVLMIRSMER